MGTNLTRRVVAKSMRRVRRFIFAARHEWLRSPPYAFRFSGFHLLYNRRNALMMRYCRDGFYEPEIERYLRATLQPGAVVVDAGANIGFFTLAVLGNSTGAIVHGFEPSPGAFELLTACIARNQLSGRVFANQVALYSEPGEMDYLMHVASHGAYDGFRDTGYAGVGIPTITPVPVTTLDLYAKQAGLERLDLLKIDVEGAELFVLQGAREVLCRLHPTVLFEVGYKNLRPFDLLPSHLFKYFEQVGYQVAGLDQRVLSEIEFSHAAVDEHMFIAFPKPAAALPATKS